jgi:hypothetical protein
MKYVFLLAAGFLFTSTSIAQVGKQFPALQGELLDGKTLTLPTTTGKKTLVGLAYSSFEIRSSLTVQSGL